MRLGEATLMSINSYLSKWIAKNGRICHKEAKFPVIDLRGGVWRLRGQRQDLRVRRSMTSASMFLQVSVLHRGNFFVACPSVHEAG